MTNWVHCYGIRLLCLIIDMTPNEKNEVKPLAETKRNSCEKVGVVTLNEKRK